MKRIEAIITCEVKGSRFYMYRASAEVLDKVPEAGDEYRDNAIIDVEQLDLDCEQDNDEPYDYVFYYISELDDEESIVHDIVAVKIDVAYAIPDELMQNISSFMDNELREKCMSEFGTGLSNREWLLKYMDIAEEKDPEFTKIMANEFEGKYL